jgi:hypothetical protein
MLSSNTNEKSTKLLFSRNEHQTKIQPMKKIFVIMALLFSILFGVLPLASASTRYTENWGTGTALAQGNGDLSMLGWTGIAQSQTAQPYLGTYNAGAVNDPVLGALPANTVYFTGLTSPAQLNGPGMFYTTSAAGTPPFGSTFTNLDPTLITNLTFNVEASVGTLTNYFAVQVGGSWYVALNSQIVTPAGGTYTNWSMVYNTNASVWNNLTIDSSLTFVTIGSQAGANLSGLITGIGIVELNNTNITGTPGDNYNRIVINQGPQDFPTSPATNSAPALTPLSVYSGGGVSFAPAFQGSPTLVFNWQTNGVSIATGANIASPTGTHYLGAQTTRLTLTNVSASDATLGITNFSVIVTNFFGQATNSGITLNIVPTPPGLLYAELFPVIGSAAGTALPGVGWAVGSVNSSGGGANLFGSILDPLGGGAMSGGTGDEFTYGATGLGTNAIYTTITNDFGLSGLPFPSINPANYPAITFQSGFAIGSGSLATMTPYWIVQMSDPVAGTNWYYSSNSIAILGSYATNQYAFSTNAANWRNLTIAGNVITPGGPASSPLTGNITGAGLLVTHRGVSGLNFQNFEIITNALAILPPVIGANYPIDISVPSGGGASFGVATTTGSQPFTYGWKTNGVAVANGGRVSGANTATLTIANLNVNDSGMQIIAFVTNSAGFDESDSGDAYGQATTLTVTNPPVGLVYLEDVPFVGPAAGNYSIGSIGWNEAVSGTPFTVFQKGTAGTTSQGDGAVFAFLGSAGTTVYYTTITSDTNQAGLPFPNINVASYSSLNFSVDIAPNSATSTNVTAYLAVQMNGVWYVSANALLGPNAAQSTTFSTYMQAFNPTAANWNNLTIVNGTGGTIGSTAANNLTGVMTGAGLVFVTVGTGGTFNFDNFSIMGSGVGGNNVGGVNISPVTSGNLNISWVGNPAVNLQSTTNLLSTWQDVANSAGLYSVQVPTTGAQKFYRLVQH